MFVEVKKEIEKLKKQLHNSIDVTSRDMMKNDVQVGFVYLKSITDNLIFSTAIYDPIL